MKTILLILFVLSSFALNSVELHFLHNTTQLTDESIELAAKFKEEFEAFFQENPNTVIFITGHADNTGTQTYNKKLSRNRSEIIRDYMVNELKVNPEYIQLYARGSNIPIASNDTEEGRYLNRRVEIVFEKPEAQIRWLQNRVEYIPSKSGEIVSAQPNDELFRFDKINTEDKSRSGIEFNDENLLILEENSLMVIFGDITSSFTNLLDDKFHVELKYGKLYNKLENMKGNSMNVKTPAADLELFSSLNNVEFSNDQTLTSIYQGYGLVFAQGAAVTVEEGYGVKVESGKEPEAPVKLPDTPSNLRITDRDPLLDGEEIYLSWDGQAHEYLLQIAAGKNFEIILLEVTESTNTTGIEFIEGSYFLRSRAVDEIGLKSDYSSSIEFDVNANEPITVKDLKEGEVTESPLESYILEGIALDKVTVVINDEETDVSPANTFSSAMTLAYGLNKIDVTAVLPNKTTKEYNYKLLYEPYVDKNVVFQNLKEHVLNVTNLADMNIIIEASVKTRLFFRGSEIKLDNNGHLEHLIRLEEGKNNISFTAEFIDGTSRVYDFEILYKKPPESMLIYEICAYIGTVLIPAIPLLIHISK